MTREVYFTRRSSFDIPSEKVAQHISFAMGIENPDIKETSRGSVVYSGDKPMFEVEYNFRNVDNGVTLNIKGLEAKVPRNVINRIKGLINAEIPKISKKVWNHWQKAG